MDVDSFLFGWVNRVNEKRVFRRRDGVSSIDIYRYLWIKWISGGLKGYFAGIWKTEILFQTEISYCQ